MSVGLRLRLEVDKKRVRYLYWDDPDRLLHLIPIWFFELILLEYPFKVSAKKDVEKFLKSILVVESEFEFEEVSVESSEIIKGEWSQPVVLTDNYIARFKRLYREKFRGWIDYEFESLSSGGARLRRGVIEKPYGYQSFKLVEIKVSKKALSNLDQSEAFFVYICSLAHNEIVALKKMAMLSTRFQNDDRLTDMKAFSNEFTVAKITAAKIYEGWELLRKFYFASRLSKKYNSSLQNEAAEYLDFLKKHFNKPNILKRVRDNFAFHYSGNDMEHVLYAIERRDFEFSLSANYLNHTFHSVDKCAFEALAASEGLDVSDALDLLRQSISEVGGKMCHVFVELIKEILFIHGETSSAEKIFESFVVDRPPVSGFSGYPLFLPLEDFEDFESPIDRFVKQK